MVKPRKEGWRGRAAAMGVPAWALLKYLERTGSLTRKKRPEFHGTSTGGVIRTVSGVVYK
mgnify:CR=1 FL=1